MISLRVFMDKAVGEEKNNERGEADQPPNNVESSQIQMSYIDGENQNNMSSLSIPALDNQSDTLSGKHTIGSDDQNQSQN